MVMVCIANDIHQHNAIHIVIVLPCTYHCDCCIDGRIEILDILIDLIEWGDLNFQAFAYGTQSRFLKFHIIDAIKIDTIFFFC